MAAIAVVRLMLRFLSLIGLAGQETTGFGSALPRSAITASLPGPPAETTTSAAPARWRVRGTAHRGHCCHAAARPIARTGTRPAEPEWLRGRYQHGAMRVSAGTG